MLSSKNILKKITSPLFYTLSVTLMLGCGGGGGDSSSDDNDSGGLQEITYTELPRLTVNEGERVEYDLNINSRFHDDMTFDWSVSLSGTQIEFEGQNTDSISFIAPEVTGDRSVSVSVAMSLNEGNLLGNDRVLTSLIVLDLDPQPPYVVSLNPDLPSVSTIDQTQFPSESTWQKYEYQASEIAENDNDFLVELNLRNITHIYNQAGEITESDCVRPSSRLDFLDTTSNHENACSADDLKTTYYQGENAIKVVAMCGDNYVFAQYYEKITDGIRSGFGELNIEIEGYPNLNEPQEVCPGTREVKLSYPENDQLLPSYASLVHLYTLYEGSPLLLELVYPDDLTSANIIIDDQENHRVKLNSNQLPTLDDIQASNVDRIIVTAFSDFDFSGSFSAEITDTNDSLINVSGDFRIDIE